MGWIAPVVVAAQRKREEEDMMARLQDENGPGYEFKMVTSTRVMWGSQEKLHELLEEEARAGWEMTGVLEGGRVFFKRPISARGMDHMLPDGYNPYRTGDSSQSVMVFAILGLVMALGVGIFVMLMLAGDGLGSSGSSSMVILIAIVVIGLVAAVLVAVAFTRRQR